MSAVAVAVRADFPDFAPVAAWAESGLMALSGAAAGPPTVPAFDAMAGIGALLHEIGDLSAMASRRVICDNRLLTERAALQRFTRRGRMSCNGSCRLLETRDGWIAINLPRDTDFESVPALTGCDPGAEPWSAIARAARSTSSADLVERGELLGLAIAEVAMPYEHHDASRKPTDAYDLHAVGAGGGGPHDWKRNPPLVIDLSALWAGPLCGQLLAAAGARVIKVESSGRPDSIRSSAPVFFDLLNAHKQSAALDFTDVADRGRLRSLIARADVVITNARPRALEQLGLEPEELLASHPGLTWVAITAHGWSGRQRNRIGFGDDAAAAAGLLTRDADGRPMFVGDAIADPLTGIAAAAGALRGLARGGGVIVDANLRAAASFVASSRTLPAYPQPAIVRSHGRWQVSTGTERALVAAPRARPRRAQAARFGADTARILRELI